MKKIQISVAWPSWELPCCPPPPWRLTFALPPKARTPHGTSWTTAANVAGFEIELGNEMCARAGVECEWVVNEWDSIIPNLVAGNYDVIMAGMSVTDERKETIMFGDEYTPADPSSFVAASSASIDMANASGLKIGAQGATIQAAYLEANLADGNDILSYESADQSVADLAAGNIDVLLADTSFLEPDCSRQWRRIGIRWRQSVHRWWCCSRLSSGRRRAC